MTRDTPEPRSRHQEFRGHPRQQSGLALGLVRPLILSGLLVTALSQAAAASNAIGVGAATTSPTGAELIEVDTGTEISRISLLGAESESGTGNLLAEPVPCQSQRLINHQINRMDS